MRVILYVPILYPPGEKSNKVSEFKLVMIHVFPSWFWSSKSTEARLMPASGSSAVLTCMCTTLWQLMMGTTTDNAKMHNAHNSMLDDHILSLLT